VGGWSAPHSGRFNLGKETRYSLLEDMRLGGPQGLSGFVRIVLPSTGIRSPDRPARSESLYRNSWLFLNRIRLESHCFLKQTHSDDKRFGLTSDSWKCSKFVSQEETHVYALMEWIRTWVLQIPEVSRVILRQQSYCRFFGNSSGFAAVLVTPTSDFFLLI
jgi:hypothetical protein